MIVIIVLGEQDKRMGKIWQILATTIRKDRYPASSGACPIPRFLAGVFDDSLDGPREEIYHQPGK